MEMKVRLKITASIDSECLPVLDNLSLYNAMETVCLLDFLGGITPSYSEGKLTYDYDDIPFMLVVGHGTAKRDGYVDYEKIREFIKQQPLRIHSLYLKHCEDCEPNVTIDNLIIEIDGVHMDVEESYRDSDSIVIF